MVADSVSIEQELVKTVNWTIEDAAIFDKCQVSQEDEEDDPGALKRRRGWRHNTGA